MKKFLLNGIFSCSICETVVLNQTPEIHLCVHHKDQNIFNNELNNLQVVCNSCHQKLHRKLEGLRR